jgi:hypothetical protein
VSDRSPINKVNETLLGGVVNGLAPYIAAGFVAALAVTSLDFSLVGSNVVTIVPSRSVDLQHSSATNSGKGDLLNPRQSGGRMQTVPTIELVGLRNATIAMLRDAAGQVRYRSDPTSGVTQGLFD